MKSIIKLTINVAVAILILIALGFNANKLAILSKFEPLTVHEYIANDTAVWFTIVCIIIQSALLFLIIYMTYNDYKRRLSRDKKFDDIIETLKKSVEGRVRTFNDNYHDRSNHTKSKPFKDALHDVVFEKKDDLSFMTDKEDAVVDSDANSPATNSEEFDRRVAEAERRKPKRTDYALGDIGKEAYIDAYGKWRRRLDDDIAEYLPK